jgi:hypothetical protein
MREGMNQATKRDAILCARMPLPSTTAGRMHTMVLGFDE